MPPLKNNRHEKLALALFKGMSQHDAAIQAGYKPNSVDVTASRLLRNANFSNSILARICELHEQATTKAVMPVIERKERLSEIARARLRDFIQLDKQGRIQKVDIQGAYSAALQEVQVTEFIGGPNQRARDRATKVKLHDPVKSIAELNKMEGEYPPSNVLKLEPGDTLGPMLAELLSKLRGYTPPAKE